MWEDYLQLLSNLYPALPNDFSDRFRKILPTITPPSKFFFYDEYKINNLLQGDIIGPIQFVEYNDNKHKKLKVDAIILSNSCDLIRKERILLAPAIPFLEAKFSDKNYINTLKKNIVFEKLYLPQHNNNTPYIIDFSRIFNLSRKEINEKYRSKRILRKLSLSKEGYYFFGLKLTVYLLRPETSDIKRESNKLD